MERVHTGVEGFDELIEGGYPKGRTILLLGTTGSAKTIMGLHFIHERCKEGKKSMIIATEEIPEDIIAQSESIGLDLKNYFEKKSLIIDQVYEVRTGHARDILCMGIERIDELQSNILGLLDRIPNDVENVLIDNIGVFTLNMSPNEFRAQFDSLIYGLSKKKITALLVLDLSADKRTDGIAAYSVYGVLKTSIRDNPYTGARERLLEVLKIRNTRISLDPIRFDITPKGIILLKK